VAPFEAVVRRHEGLTMASGSHTRFCKDKLDQVAGPPMEDVVAKEAFMVFDGADSVFMDAMTQALTETNKADSPEYRPSYCLFKY